MSAVFALYVTHFLNQAVEFWMETLAHNDSCSCYCRPDQPPARLQMRQYFLEESRRRADVFDDLEDGDDIEALFGRGWQRELFDWDVQIGKAIRLEKEWIGSLVSFCYCDDFWRRVDGCDRRCVW